MVQLPTHSEILKHAFGQGPATGTATNKNATGDTTRTAPATRAVDPAGPLAALQDVPEPIEPVFRQTAARQRQQELQNRARVDAVQARLMQGDGVQPFNPHDPTGGHFCFRDQNRVLSIGSHAAYMAGHEPAFVLHLHGAGLMARQDGVWIENPDAAFFEALDAASRAAQQSFIV